MDAPHFDIAITGAGPVGSTLALLLASRAPNPSRIALVDPFFRASSSPNDAPVNAPSDPRLLALNQGSRQLLESVGLAIEPAANIETVHVSQYKRLGRTLIRHSEQGVPQLGSVVSYQALRQRLHKQLHESGISLIGDYVRTISSDTCPRIQLSHETLVTRLAVQSDGGKNTGLQRRYHQKALTVTVRASQAKPDWAFERFTRQGPLAFLPHPDGDDLYGLVWCCTPQRAEQLAAAPDDEFSAALHQQFGERLGQLTPVSKRFVLDLALNVAPQLVNPSTVAIGNAAQTLHPVAGQGLNLGLRDAALLSQTLSPWLSQLPSTATPALENFLKKRDGDRWLTSAITDFLSRIFTSKSTFVHHAAGLGLLTIDLVEPLQRPLSRHLLYGWRN